MKNYGFSLFMWSLPSRHFMQVEKQEGKLETQTASISGLEALQDIAIEDKKAVQFDQAPQLKKIA
ncbi:hypothetical protein TDB9533_00231 [Thalassocella blandensis]|nr:hypothetical protein TDB9533_00231 [Thalassocella blandensis]